MINLTAIQMDLLKETLNLGVGQAALALSELAGGEEILLSVPTVELKTLDELLVEIQAQSGSDVCGVSEGFTGSFPGHAVMLYSQQESLELVRVMLQVTIPVEHISEMEGEALTEVGNIVLNACISCIANLLETEIQTDVPRLYVGDCRDVIQRAVGYEVHQLLHLKMLFSFAKHRLTGHIGFLFDLPAVEALAQGLEVHFKKVINTKR